MQRNIRLKIQIKTIHTEKWNDYNTPNKSQFFIVVLLLLLLLSCKDKKDFPKVLTIPIKDVTIRPLLSNDIFTQIEYIPLETLPECLLVENSMEVYATDKYIVTNNSMFRSGAYLFDRQTGKFLYEIGKKGQGPDEYNFIYPYPFNEEYELFYVIRFLQRIGINIGTNKVVEKVFNPVSSNSVFDKINYLATSIVNIFKMDSIHYIAYINNDSGDNPDLLVIFGQEGNIIKTYPNHQKYIKYIESISEFNPGIFYKYDNQLYFQEYFYNDTVFQINLDTIMPHIIFDLGKMKPNSLERQNNDYNKNCYWIEYVHETTNYIFFKYSSGSRYAIWDGYYDGYYNKETGELVAALSISKELRGFVNENDIYPPFSIASINQSEEIIGIIPPTNMLDYIEKNKQIVYPSKLNSLQVDDNPVIVIAKLKK